MERIGTGKPFFAAEMWHEHVSMLQVGNQNQVEVRYHVRQQVEAAHSQETWQQIKLSLTVGHFLMIKLRLTHQKCK